MAAAAADGWIPLHHAVHEKAESDVVAYRVQKCPASVWIRTRDSQYFALHIALEVEEQSLRVIRCLVRQWPESVREPSDDIDKYLPLHMAVFPDKSERGVALEYTIIRFLVRRYPHALRVKVDDMGWLPIHGLVVYQTPFDFKTLRLLVTRYPEALLVRDDYGYLPVHLIAKQLRMFPGDEDAPRFASRVFQYLVAQCPTSAQLGTPEGQILIHLALQEWEWVSVDDIRFLLLHSPDSIRTRNRDRDLPLHVAVRAGKVEVVRFLVEQRPRFLRRQGGKGRLPAHVAAATTGTESLALLRLLVRRWPESIHEPDDDGRTPLHLAVCGPPPERGGGSRGDKVRYLAGMSPQALGARDKQGRIPLHVAMEQGKTLSAGQVSEVLECVRCLIDRRPAGLLQGDFDGNLPLHVAADRWVPVPVLKHLMDVRPEALQVKNHQGLLPVQLALGRNRSEIEIPNAWDYMGERRSYARRLEIQSVQILVEHCPESVLERFPPHNGTLVHYALTGPQKLGRRVALFLLQQCPEAARTADSQGLLPLHVAASTNAPLNLLYSMMHLQQGFVRAQTRRREDRPVPPSATTTTTATTAGMASGPRRSKRARTGEPQH